MHTTTSDDRRMMGDRPATHTANDMAGSISPACYQASAEPMRRPDNKAKKHSRPTKWATRQARIAQREQEYAA